MLWRKKSYTGNSGILCASGPDAGGRPFRRHICRRRRVYAGALAFFLAAATYLAYRWNVIPHRAYDSAVFGIENIKSSQDRDGDGIDDQTDILAAARAYTATEPRYRSRYYEGGYPDDCYGVCTDVVAFALRDAGFDLMTLVDADVRQHPADYKIAEPDPNIDFRRVRNLRVYLEHNAISLTTDLSEIAQWQGGDIVVFRRHIGIVSDRRNKKGIPFVIHNANPLQCGYEEDILETWGEIVGHYRISE